MAAIASIGFIKLLCLSEDLCNRVQVPEYLKPIMGCLLLGLVGILSFKIDGFPRVFGIGYDTIGQTLFGGLSLQVTLALFFLKL